MRRALATLAVLALTGCGSGLSLSNLRCDGACQSVDDPFTLTLEVDYDDPDGALAHGSLQFKFEDVVGAGTESTASLVTGAGRSGTMHFAVPLKLTAIQDGEALTLGVTASGAGETSDQVERAFVLHL